MESETPKAFLRLRPPRGVVPPIAPEIVPLTDRRVSFGREEGSVDLFVYSLPFPLFLFLLFLSPLTSFLISLCLSAPPFLFDSVVFPPRSSKFPAHRFP